MPSLIHTIRCYLPILRWFRLIHTLLGVFWENVVFGTEVELNANQPEFHINILIGFSLANVRSIFIFCRTGFFRLVPMVCTVPGISCQLLFSIYFSLIKLLHLVRCCGFSKTFSFFHSSSAPFTDSVLCAHFHFTIMLACFEWPYKSSFPETFLSEICFGWRTMPMYNSFLLVCLLVSSPNFLDVVFDLFGSFFPI